jgi:exopolysaccharide production protein ExoZ
MQTSEQVQTENEVRPPSIMSRPHEQNRYYSVQSLRALAALMVVMYHSVKILSDRMSDARGMDFHAGAMGVDVFFCISGFVIVMSTIDSSNDPKSWLSFLWRRVSRIVPLYWLATVLKLVLLIALPRLAQHSAIRPWHTLASFLFIPAWNTERQAMPLLTQGWSLSFEMLFYGLFAAALALRLKPVPWVTGLLVALSAADLARQDDWWAVSTLLKPILLEFVFGMTVALLILRGRYLPKTVALLLVLAMPVLLVANNALPEVFCTKYSALVAGVPAGLLLFGAVSLETRARTTLAGMPNLLGDASYAIYLFHGFLIQPLVLGLIRLHVHGLPALGITTGTSIVVSGAAGILIHLKVELPLIKFFRRHSPATRLALLQPGVTG